MQRNEKASLLSKHHNGYVFWYGHIRLALQQQSYKGSAYRHRSGREALEDTETSQSEALWSYG